MFVTLIQVRHDKTGLYIKCFNSPLGPLATGVTVSRPEVLGVHVFVVHGDALRLEFVNTSTRMDFRHTSCCASAQQENWILLGSPFTDDGNSASGQHPSLLAIEADLSSSHEPYHSLESQLA